MLGVSASVDGHRQSSGLAFHYVSWVSWAAPDVAVSRACVGGLGLWIFEKHAKTLEFGSARDHQHKSTQNLEIEKLFEEGGSGAGPLLTF